MYFQQVDGNCAILGLVMLDHSITDDSVVLGTLFIVIPAQNLLNYHIMNVFVRYIIMLPILRNHHKMDLCTPNFA